MKQENIERAKESTKVNEQFASRSDDRPEKRDYRHANMKQEFRSGVIDYAKHMRWMEQ
ncbi:MAG: hypothetical protein [Bacteriophage sp.]|nr:MAG: hypothetical protein [Bacteriophage sp.]